MFNGSRRIIIIFLIALAAVVSLEGQGSLDSAKAFLRGTGKYEKGPGTQRESARMILTYNNDAIDGIYEILTSNSQMPLWKDAFYGIGIIGSVDQASADSESLLAVVRNLEDIIKESLPETDRRSHLMVHLKYAYLAVGRQTYRVWKPFFDERLDEGFWGDRIPIFKTLLSIGGPISVENPLDFMIFGATVLGEPEAIEWIQNLVENHPYLSESRVADRIYRSFVGIGRDRSGMDYSRQSHQQDLAVYEKHFGVAEELPEPSKIETVAPIEPAHLFNQQSPAVVDDSQ